jgi:hypothetical protein
MRSKESLNFAHVVKTFAGDRRVSQDGGKGFGSGALKVNGKIFAMMSSKGQFVVKLPKDRVDELIASGAGNRFEPSRGRVMKEWVVLAEEGVNWAELGKEACEFAKRRNP